MQRVIAVDKSSGLFKEASRSYWTPEGTTDGDSVLKGGAAVNLIKENNIFTHFGYTKESLNTTLSTSTISKDMLGLAQTSTDEHSAVIDWLNRKQGMENAPANGRSTTQPPCGCELWL